MRVASSLESLVIGEPQILGQLKEAVRWTRENSFPIDNSLERVFQLVFETAKRVRTETGVSEKPVSVASLGLNYLVSHESAFPLKRAVVIGRSPMGLIILQWLKKNRPECPITWVNRSVDKLKEYSECDGVELKNLAEFLQTPGSYSHLFTATSSREPFLNRPFFERSTEPRKLVFDFAEPMDVSDDGLTTTGVTVIKLGDLQEEAHANRALRAKSVGDAEVLIDEALKNYCLQQKEAPLIRDFSDVEASFYENLSQALLELEIDLTPNVQAKISKWAESLIKKNLHLSREHLRAILRKISDPETASSPVL